MDQTSLTRRNLTLAPLGIAPVQDASPYACTPKGARLIGAAGVDGVHYCFVRGFAETVFAVSPMNAPGEQVHPIARSLPELLRLQLACGSADASFTISTPMLEPWHGAFSTAGSPIFSTIRAAISSTVISLLCTAIYSDVGSPAAFSIFFV